ncbi:thioredoxin-like protein [Pyronema domesticum]|uniref:Similar to Monothiol glutaredoxin-7 acc. no. P38068 n=1 Tax=Pyronema omphalodes (strain CBS 100304) TaxID=1076935 RepID=U4LHP1_PYROM|nr:thioredoxin-like protein [Pyronema domesticum]CCX16178.1 Similar to Monothiol glutaredoxin-7; acc. no. P38068 [Pyronema omphalodes CBS 100304]
MITQRRTRSFLLAFSLLLIAGLYLTLAHSTPRSANYLHQLRSVASSEQSTELTKLTDKYPIIIFSKSYCPYSAKAKAILTEKYRIVPEPLVVEIDKHPKGLELQEALEKATGRRTVPNILVNGRSIGGCDDIKDLDALGRLPDTIRNYGGSKIQQVFVLKE